MESASDSARSEAARRSMGTLLEAGWRLYRRALRPTLAATLVFTGIAGLLAALIGHGLLLPLYDEITVRLTRHAPRLWPPGALQRINAGGGMLVLFLLLLTLFQSLNLGSIARLAADKAASPSSYASVVKRGLILFLWVMLFIALLLISLLPAAYLMVNPFENPGWSMVWLTVAMLPSLYVSVTFAFGPNSVIQDGLNPVSAFVHNFRLVSRQWWRTLGFTLMIYTLVHTVIAVAIVIAAQILLFTEPWSLQDVPALVRLLLMALGYGTFLGGVLSLPFYNAMLVVFYNDLKTRAQRG